MARDADDVVERTVSPVVDMPRSAARVTPYEEDED
jgi:hypothetical protein